MTPEMRFYVKQLGAAVRSLEAAIESRDSKLVADAHDAVLRIHTRFDSLVVRP